MNPFRQLRSFFRKEKLETEMSEEMRHHVELQTELNVKAGMSPDEARYAAWRQFGNVAVIQEQAREGRGWVWLEQFRQDLRYGIASLWKNAGFTSVVVFTLALGLGVNTALFTWFNAAAFRPLPVASPEQLVALKRLDANGNENATMSYTDFVTYRDHQTVFTGLAAAAGSGVELLDTGESDRVQPIGLYLETVSTNYFSVFGVPMALGRPLIAADETSTRALPVIVLSHRFWQNYLGGDPAVIGRTLRLRGLAEEALTIVGVTGPEFHGTKPGASVGWVPLLLRRGEAWRTDLKATGYALTGRLRPGLGREQAVEELQVIANDLLARPGAGPAQSETIVLTKASSYLNLTAQHMVVLLPMICLFGAVFVISCANASNLMLARTVTRQFEFAVRSALGATRGRLFRQIMTESLVLGALGGLVGWLVSAGLLRFAWPWLLNMVPAAREGTEGLYLHADYRVFGFTLIVSLLAGATGGLFPAVQVTRRNVDSGLKRDGSVFGAKVRLSRVRSFLAVGQLALSSALVFTAGLLAHRVLSTRFADAGFDQAPMLTYEVLAPRAYEAPQVDNARRQVMSRLRSLPEVAAISEMPRFPFAPRQTKVSILSDNQAGPRVVNVIHAAVPANYFATLQLPMIRGRAFAPDEIAGNQVAVISETAARTFWPDGDALGKGFTVPSAILPGRETAAEASTNDADLPRTSLTVIGIVHDTRVYDPWSGDRPVIYLPLAPQAAAAPYLLIRLNKAIGQVPAALRQAGLEVTGIAPRIVTVEELFATAGVQYRVIAWVAGMLAAISLIVAVIGLYGAMSFMVNQRVKEIGIRIALGATSGRVLAEIIFQSLRLVGVGAAVGYGLSVLITLAARTLLFGVSPFDPLVAGVVVLLLGALGLLACWFPARRAAKVDPMVALRAE